MLLDHHGRLFAPPRPAAEALFDAEDRGWHGLTGPSREPPAPTRRRLLRDLDEVWRSNPYAHSIVELLNDMTLGEGVTIRSPDPATDAFVRRFWHHPANRVPIEQFTWATELALTGDLFLTYHTNPVDGMTYVRCLPTSLVAEVETDPDDVLCELRYHQDEPAERWWSSQDCHHWSINRLAGTSWGQSDLAVVLPWLRRYVGWLRDRVDSAMLRNAFIYDVELKTADPAVIQARTAELGTGPRPGSVMVHGDSESWRAVSAGVAPGDLAADGRAVRKAIGVGARLPMHLLSEAEDANRATAQEQKEPTLRHWRRRQLLLGAIFVQVCRTALERSGQLGPDQIGPLEPVFPDLDRADNLNLGRAAQSLTAALATATDRGWLSGEEARTLLLDALGRGMPP
jgi:hypothetical protein